MSNTPTLAQLLKKAIDARLLDIHTAIVGRIENYDSKTQLANIQPVLKRALRSKDGAIKEEELPLLLEVPVLFPRAGEFFISLPLKKGDFVQVIFNEVAVQNFLDESAPQTVSERRFTLDGAVAIPGSLPPSKTLTGAHKDNLVIGRDGGAQIHLDGHNIKLGSSQAHEALAIASSVRKELKNIRKKFNSHFHESHFKPPTRKIRSIPEISATRVLV